ncbi:MBL fold metallo-hydrolase [Roseobacter sp. HKCCA0434]|uniref:MBL fold metallo-hydrolase n=1 Tax=Roseobacter sp. HKCCA0434 TaxID=3079297 RepID=UPI002905A84B|nr:MBL fold metallo-hydrolase [Roseobacter sp. HKCCA0434]
MDRRRFLATSGALTGAMVLPYAAMAQGGESHSYATDGGEVVIHPVDHASFVMETPGLVIYNDPVGEAARYAEYPAPDLILVTHEHGDHYNVQTLRGIVTDTTKLIVNPGVFRMLPDDLKARAMMLSNGDTTHAGPYYVAAVPAYNITEDRLQYHPQGRDNGYVLTVDGLRVYIAGDTENVPEMAHLEEIDIAFLPMNLPYTMDVAQAADAVAMINPRVVYPYHYRGSDIDAFTRMVGADAEVRRGDWYS